MDQKYNYGNVEFSMRYESNFSKYRHPIKDVSTPSE